MEELSGQGLYQLFQPQHKLQHQKLRLVQDLQVGLTNFQPVASSDTHVLWLRGLSFISAWGGGGLARLQLSTVKAVERLYCNLPQGLQGSLRYVLISIHQKTRYMNVTCRHIKSCANTEKNQKWCLNANMSSSGFCVISCICLVPKRCLFNLVSQLI